MRRGFRQWLRVLVSLAPLVVGASVVMGQTPQAQPGTPAPGGAGLETLKERVLAYWQARVRKDYRTQYDLLEPRGRAVNNPEEYGRGRQVEYLAAQVEDAERRGNFARARVRLLVRIQIPAMLPRTAPIQRTETTVLDDYWVRIGDTWYRTVEADAGRPPPWPAVDE